MHEGLVVLGMVAGLVAALSTVGVRTLTLHFMQLSCPCQVAGNIGSEVVMDGTIATLHPLALMGIQGVWELVTCTFNGTPHTTPDDSHHLQFSYNA